MRWENSDMGEFFFLLYHRRKITPTAAFCLLLSLLASADDDLWVTGHAQHLLSSCEAPNPFDTLHQYHGRSGGGNAALVARQRRCRYQMAGRYSRDSASRPPFLFSRQSTDSAVLRKSDFLASNKMNDKYLLVL